MRFTRFVLLAGLALAPALGGCARQTDVDNLQGANRGLQQRLVELEQEVESLQGTNASLRTQLNQANARADAETRARSMTASDLENLQGEYERLTGRLENLEFAILPAEIDTALRDLAAAHPELMSYDPQRGMVRLASDLTFALGSDQVNDSAKQSLNRLADVLKSGAATNFEVRVVGHTDQVPIRRAETMAKHPTNMHLSVHRAISVRDVLVNQGVESSRVSVAGWGPYRPAVASASGAAPQNRRVELYILPMSASTPMATAPEEGGEMTNAPATPEEPMK
ncbi:MAG: OmpA family protein [Phycisphaerales bacterium]